MWPILGNTRKYCVQTELIETNRSAARVKRITWSSERLGVSWSVFDGTDDEPIDAPMFDDMLPIELNAEPILALPLIDDGL